MTNEIKNYEIISDYGDRQNIESADVAMEKALIENELARRVATFNGLMAVTDIIGSDAKVPRSKRISSLRKKLNQLDRVSQERETSLNEQSQAIAAEFGTDFESAKTIVNTATLLTEDLASNGLIYKNKPYNLAILPPYPVSKERMNRISELSTKALDGLYNLALSDQEVMELLNRGSTDLEKKLFGMSSGYSWSAPVNRIDIADGRIIEFGPTYADGFGTVATLAEAWGINSQAPKILADTFISAYEQFCASNNIKPKDTPSLGLIYIGATQDMRDEMRTLGNLLAEDERISEINLGRPDQVMIKKPDIVFYYLKPSMIEGVSGQPVPESQEFVFAYSENTCIVPPFREQLGKKAALAIFQMYPDYFSAFMGENNYQEFMGYILPTQIVTPDTPLPDENWILKPSSSGSCDGVIGSENPNFIEEFTKAQQDYTDPTKDIWVIQQKASESIPVAWVVNNQKGKIVRLENPTVKQTVFIAGGKFAGAYATVDSNWIIDDGGFSFPCQPKGEI